MNLKYFANCKTKQDAKKVFRELAKANHPDRGGSHEDMIVIIAEYEKVMKILPNDATGSEHKNQTEEEFTKSVSEEMQTIIDNIAHLPINVEIIGTWIWVSGNTYPYKSYLTAYNFVWCPKKKMFQWHMERDSQKGYRGKVQEIEKIRNKYGSMKVNNVKLEAIV